MRQEPTRSAGVPQAMTRTSWRGFVFRARRDAIARHGGHFINYYSRFSTENLAP